MLTNILVIDDSTFICMTVENILNSSDVKVSSAYTAKEAFAWLQDHMPDAILLDLVLPDRNGYEVCKELKQMPKLKDVPIIFLTSNSTEAGVLDGFDAGATDYIVKPFSPVVLKARVSCHLKNKMIMDELRVAYDKLEHAVEEIRLQGLKDPLTNVFNRRFFIENMTRWKSTLNQQEAFVILLDIDDFKHFNDAYGHCTGDYILYTVADIITKCVDKRAVVGRWGGDEFLIFIKNCSVEEILSTTQLLMEAIRFYPFCYDSNALTCHITAGISRFDVHADIEENINQADEALYEGKRKGKNCFVFRDTVHNPISTS